MTLEWRRRGRIFDPFAHQLPAGCTAFAQSPQTLVFDDYVRVFFSTRAVDAANGKYLSHVAFVDLAMDLETIVRISSEPVIALGGLGAFDEHGIFPMNVLSHAGQVLGYTCGWSRRISVSVETAIGLAVSRDGGNTFVRQGEGPVMAPTPDEPFLVGDPFVRVIGNVFHMWYIFGTAWRSAGGAAAPDRTYKIGHATSTNGLDWRREGGRPIIADRLGPDECQALPSVIEIDGSYLMAFCYRQSFDFRENASRGYRLGFAWSDDLVTWTRDDRTPRFDIVAGEWDADMQCYPHLFRVGDDVHLLYNGNRFGRDGFGLATLKR